tara:strand:+ start:2580 stop:2831 length:252 start_codon:yes stop_codon:yes gene_type:complete
MMRINDNKKTKGEQMNIKTRVCGKLVTGKSMFECLVKGLGFFPVVDKTTTIPQIEKQVAERSNILGSHVQKFIKEKANMKGGL